jgi:chromosome segregation protein
MSSYKEKEQKALMQMESEGFETPSSLWTSLEWPEDKALPTLDSVREKFERSKRERENMGAVNLMAAEEAENTAGEIETMIKEREDLVEAISKLRQAIQKLNKEARVRMVDAFDKVNEHFKRLFTQLFNGGEAHLELTESDDILESGLEIFASPPGKKLQNLTLLSGGEQTLASIALIFAMFLTKPAPICVLDEIDAPLDDANVDRVCTMIEEIGKITGTRFMIITHHRMTMARMDRLYGVTMAERGISQLVSVDLQQKLFDDLVAA